MDLQLRTRTGSGLFLSVSYVIAAHTGGTGCGAFSGSVQALLQMPNLFLGCINNAV
jgi:hypothetical protein